MIRGIRLTVAVLVLAAIAYGQHTEAVDAPVGEQTLRTFDWENTKLHVYSHSTQPTTNRLLTVEQPAITSSNYAIIGRIRYEGVDDLPGVEGDAYLEMWSYFPDGSFYFARTLADTGPMAKITGQSDWREFILPFNNKPGHPPPTKLEINLILPARGAVYFEPMKLVEYSPRITADTPSLPGNARTLVGQWWSDRQGGWIGGISGTVFGCRGGLIGLLAGKGKAKRFVLNYTQITADIWIWGSLACSCCRHHVSAIRSFLSTALAGLAASDNTNRNSPDYAPALCAVGTSQDSGDGCPVMKCRAWYHWRLVRQWYQA